MSLRELTQSYHQEAERQEFVSVLMSGKINPDLYATFLWNQYFRYHSLERMAQQYKLFDGYEGLCRAESIYNDYKALWKYPFPPAMTIGTVNYMHYIQWEIGRNPEALMAHIYVNHMGDMAGGQMISARIPGLKSMYNFDTPDVYKDYIRSQINDDMFPHASKAFEWATELFREMMRLNLERTVE